MELINFDEFMKDRKEKYGLEFFLQEMLESISIFSYDFIEIVEILFSYLMIRGDEI